MTGARYVPDYERKIAEANPLHINMTADGTPLTNQEAAFIHYYVMTGNAIAAFKSAGFTLPRLERNRIVNNLVRENNTDNRGQDEEDISKDNTENNNLQVAEYEDEELEEILKKEYTIIPKIEKQPKTQAEYESVVSSSASNLLLRPSIAREVRRRISLLDDAYTADAQEIYHYFTAVMRGQVLDQFGLEASLQERTRAAEALAKRLIDIPRKLEVAGQINGQAINLVIQPREETPIETTFCDENTEE